MCFKNLIFNILFSCVVVVVMRRSEKVPTKNRLKDWGEEKKQTLEQSREC